jgi:AGZA family xanthine/uracil permease-like MFS transporter
LFFENGSNVIQEEYMLNRFFQLGQRRTNVRTECIAGLTTFLTMAYIIFVNPAILSQAGMNKEALIAVTCLVTAVSTIATGLFANAPIAMAPGMGLNAFFAFTLVITRKVSWQTALGVVFLSGLFFLILTLVGLRKKLVEAIPQSLISAIAVGIGLFITFIGLQNLGLIKSDPVTFVSGAALNRTILIGLAGLLVMIYLEVKHIPGALLLGILCSTVLAMVFGQIQPPQRVISTQFHLSELFLKMDVIGALKWSLFSSIFTLMFIDMFDSIGTLLAVVPQAGLADKDGKIKSLDRLLVLDAGATMFGAVCGTSTTTAYIESAAGVEQGGRTGLTAVVTGILFLLAMPFVPLVDIVPKYATAPALIMVGLFMMKEICRIDFSDIRHGLPAFVIIVMIALSYSISTGLAFGFIAFTLMEVMAGRIREIKPTMWLIAVLSIFYFCV